MSSITVCARLFIRADVMHSVFAPHIYVSRLNNWQTVMLSDCFLTWFLCFLVLFLLLQQQVNAKAERKQVFLNIKDSSNCFVEPQALSLAQVNVARLKEMAAAKRQQRLSKLLVACLLFFFWAACQ